jgi:hypothetical protein
MVGGGLAGCSPGGGGVGWSIGGKERTTRENIEGKKEDYGEVEEIN